MELLTGNAKEVRSALPTYPALTTLSAIRVPIKHTLLQAETTEPTASSGSNLFFSTQRRGGGLDDLGPFAGTQ